ncbi:MAG: hypothetical protein ACKOBG_04535 [Actinomycetota bacterium]
MPLPSTRLHLSALVATVATVMSFGFAGPVAAAAPGDLVWANPYTGSGTYAAARHIARSRDGRIVFVAANFRPAGVGTTLDISIVATDAVNGARRWTAILAGAAGLDDFPSGIVASPTADVVFVTGQFRTASGGRSWVTRAYASGTGAPIWTRTFGGSGTRADQPAAITIGPGGGRVYVTGRQDLDTGYEVRTIAYNAATGATAWSRATSTTNGQVNVRAIAINPLGNRIFVGAGMGTGNQLRATILGYAASDGSPLWSRSFDPTAGLAPGTQTNDGIWAIGVSPDGTRVYGTGVSTTGIARAAMLNVAVAAGTGAPIWSQRRGGSLGYSYGTGLAVGPGGARIFVVGTLLSPTNDLQVTTLALRSDTGVKAWSRATVGTGPNSGDDTWSAIVIAPAGDRVYTATGVYDVGTSYDSRVTAFATADGIPLWDRGSPGSTDQYDTWSAITIGPSGRRIYLTGERMGALDTRAPIVAYAT